MQVAAGPALTGEQRDGSGRDRVGRGGTGRAGTEEIRRGQAPGSATPARRLTADARRAQLFEVALGLFAERGYAATTMDEIAETAGVTKPLLYQHFDSKRALYLELMDVFSQAIIDRIVAATAAADGPRQQVERGFSAYFAMVAENEQAFRLLYGRDAPDDRELGAALRRVEQTIATAIDPLIDAGLDAEHRHLLAHAVVGMAEGASRSWIDARRRAAVDGGPGSGNGDLATADLLASRLADFAWTGLRGVRRI